MTSAIHLHGRLGRRFGPQFDLDVDTPAEAIRALCTMLRGFRAALSEGAYRVVRGRVGLVPEGLGLRLGDKEMHIIPAAAGAKNAGTGKIIAGVILLVAAVVTAGVALAAAPAGAGVLGTAMSAGAVASTSAVGIAGVATVSQLGFLGLGLVLTGASMLLSSQPKSQNALSVDQNPSFMFSGPAQTYAQGGAVPLIYGECMVGSIVGAAALKSDDYSENPAIDTSTLEGKIAANTVFSIL